jgi:hypothetical protein
VEITTRYAKAYAAASKSEKGRVLDEVVSVTGWSRDNARRRLTAAAASPPGSGRQVARRPRKPRRPKFSYDARKVLQRVWAATGGQCGKYLVVSMRLNLDLLQAHDKLVFGAGRYSESVRVELLSMSAASIDRYLQGAKASDPLTKGASTTKPSPLLRSSITIRKAGDEVEAEPGFFEGDTVAHCGPSLKGEFARTVNLTCVHTGWVFTRSVRNNAHTHILSALNRACQHGPVRGRRARLRQRQRVPQPRRHRLGRRRRRSSSPGPGPTRRTTRPPSSPRTTTWLASTPSTTATTPPKSCGSLNRLWPLVNDRLNYLTPTKKPIGYGRTATRRRTRLYDSPPPLGPAARRRGPLPAQQAAMTSLPRQPEPRRHRPPDRRPANTCS